MKHRNQRDHNDNDPRGHDYHFGAAPRPALVRTNTVTGQAAGLVNLAARPVKWAFFQTGNLVKWVGGTLQTIGNKL